MQTVHEILDEELQMEYLQSYRIIDTAPEVEYDELVELAANICGCPTALMALLDGQRFWNKAKFGTKLAECARKESLCQHVVFGNEEVVVEDASKDERFKNNIYVMGPMSIRFYAAVPIISRKGAHLGTICVMNDKPGTINAVQIRSLHLIANQVMRLMELRVNNREIMANARQHIRKKNKLVLKTVSMQEKRNALIATTLHENLAQALAANKLYLQMAEESEPMRLPLIRKANDNIGKLVEEICNLSNAIIPSSLQRVPLKELLHDLAQQSISKGNFNVMFECDGEVDELSFEVRVVLFKAVDKWLKMLSHRDTVKNVRISISVFETVILTIEDDGTHHNIEEIENDEATMKMEARISILGGSGELTHLSPRGNMLTVMI